MDCFSRRRTRAISLQGNHLGAPPVPPEATEHAHHDFSQRETIPVTPARRQAHELGGVLRPLNEIVNIPLAKMTRYLKHAAWPGAVMAVCAGGLWSQEAAPAPSGLADAWAIHQPYPNNPLRQATIAGSLTAAGEQRPAELQIECRAPELARLNLLFRAPGMKFKLDPFEGPPGIGQKRKLLQVRLDHDPPRAYFFNGFYVESDTFVFAVALPRPDLRSIVSSEASTKPVSIQILPAEGQGEPLVFTFTLPAASVPAQDVARPCMEGKAKEREPDSE